VGAVVCAITMTSHGVPAPADHHEYARRKSGGTQSPSPPVCGVGCAASAARRTEAQARLPEREHAAAPGALGQREHAGCPLSQTPIRRPGEFLAAPAAVRCVLPLVEGDTGLASGAEPAAAGAKDGRRRGAAARHTNEVAIEVLRETPIAAARARHVAMILRRDETYDATIRQRTLVETLT
jgi:hypothetical protein